MDDQAIIPVILSGGSGTRLWPLSRTARPKQFQRLDGEQTMLQATAARFVGEAGFATPWVVAGAAQQALVTDQLGEESLGTLILEPAPRNTAPAIALAALAAGADDLLLVLPSDHLIRDAAAFRDAVRTGAAAARDGWVVTFGMEAVRPETGYGYVQRGAPLSPGIFAVERFVEKPDLATAQAYCADGGFDWNGGIFLFRAETMIEALAAHAPDVLAASRAALAGAERRGVTLLPDAQAFAAAPSVSIDYAVMEKAGRIAVVPVSAGWSDVGSWEALHEVSALDEAGNAQAGPVLAIEARNCLIHSDGLLVAAVGVEDLVIVATGDTILVVPRSQSQRVKEIVEALKADGRADLT